MHILSKINWIDIFSLIIIARMTYVSLEDGLSHEIFPLIGSIITACASIQYYHPLALFIGQYAVSLPASILDFFAFLSIIVIMIFVLKLLKMLVDMLFQVTWNPVVEKIGGAICGFFRGLILASLILITLALLPLSYFQHSIRDRSLSGMFIINIAPAIHNKLSWMFPAIKIDRPFIGASNVVEKIVSDKSVK